MRAADCPRRFTLLADGGVRVSYACGEVVVVQSETAVDVAVLEDHISRTHHHRRLHHRHP